MSELIDYSTENKDLIVDFGTKVEINISPKQDENILIFHFTVQSCGKEKNRRLHFKLPAKFKNLLHEKEIVLDQIFKHFPDMLADAVLEVVLQSVGDLIKSDKDKMQRELLKRTKHNFRTRNKMQKSSQETMTPDAFVQDFINAWNKLEKETGKQIYAPTKAQIAAYMKPSRSEKTLSKHIEKFRLFTAEDALKDAPNNRITFGSNGASFKPKPTYRTFRNYVRVRREPQKMNPD